jgi:hypothetical protein
MGLACEHPEAKWRNKNSKVIKSEELAFGLYELIHLAGCCTLTNVAQMPHKQRMVKSTDNSTYEVLIEGLNNVPQPRILTSLCLGLQLEVESKHCAQ